MTITMLGRTDVGAVRKNNEDAYVILPDRQVAAVADGMGGAAAGEVASRIFVDTVQEYSRRLVPTSEVDVDTTIREAFLQGNARIIQSAVENPDYNGMGCTAEVIGFFEDRYVVGHVGDSRTYLFRDGELLQLTRDHSLVQHQVEQGLISEAEARNHSLKNVVLRALGIDPSLCLDIVRGRVLPHDIFLLCSDGLTDMLPDEKIKRVLSSGFSLGRMLDRLIEEALSGGGRDNITVVLCEATE